MWQRIIRRGAAAARRDARPRRRPHEPLPRLAPLRDRRPSPLRTRSSARSKRARRARDAGWDPPTCARLRSARRTLGVATPTDEDDAITSFGEYEALSAQL